MDRRVLLVTASLAFSMPQLASASVGSARADRVNNQAHHGLFARHKSFFKGQLLATDKAPHRVVRHRRASLTQFRRQRPHGEVRFLGERGPQPIRHLALDDRFGRRSARPCRKIRPSPRLLPKADRRGGTNPEPQSHRAHRFA